MSEIYQIAIRSPLRDLLVYESAQALPKGARVEVPLRRQKRVGIVWSKVDQLPKNIESAHLKAISQLIDEEPLFDATTLDFYQTASDYYGLALGELLNFSLPKKIREGGTIVNFGPKSFVPALPHLSEAQSEVVQQIRSHSGFQSHLLIGETGSGKTEIYLKLMEEILVQGGQVLMLVPEISLTPQIESRLETRLGAAVSVFHSGLKESARFESFCRARSGGANIFLGARSALFLPFKDLKLIVVDEEHDASYKQNERGTYHARDLAILKAKLLGIPVVLGSATPSLESLYRARSQKTPIYKIPRFFSAPKVKSEVIDLKKTWKKEEKSFITSRLHRAIQDALQKGDQALLFLNRRGSATQRVCVSCGHAEGCPHCSACLTLHFDTQTAICHLCGFEKAIEKMCSKCEGKDFFVGGIGTKEVETQIQERFPEARVGRLDRDQAKKKNESTRIIRAFVKGELDILVGTQMISKGIDIARLSLVGIILADQGWNVPDFRAMERSFQLLHQIKGRGGRRGQQTEFIVQTFNPEHPLFTTLEQSESEAWQTFADQELKLRELAALPPFHRYLLWTCSHRQESLVMAESEALVQRMSKLARRLGIELMGPTPCPLYKWRNEFRFQILAKSSQTSPMTSFLGAVLDDFEKRPLQSRVRWDRDPVQFM